MFIITEKTNTLIELMFHKIKDVKKKKKSKQVYFKRKDTDFNRLLLSF